MRSAAAMVNIEVAEWGVRIEPLTLWAVLDMGHLCTSSTERALEAVDSQLTAGYDGMSTKLDVLGQKTAGQVHVSTLLSEVVAVGAEIWMWAKRSAAPLGTPGYQASWMCL